LRKSEKNQSIKEIDMLPKNFALGKINYIIIAVAVVIIITGFLLMTGASTTVEGGFDPEIFSARRIKVAPATCFFGFLIMIVGILYPDKKS
jgi:hypothetical protein